MKEKKSQIERMKRIWCRCPSVSLFLWINQLFSPYCYPQSSTYPYKKLIFSKLRTKISRLKSDRFPYLLSNVRNTSGEGGWEKLIPRNKFKGDSNKSTPFRSPWNSLLDVGTSRCRRQNKQRSLMRISYK